MDSRNPPVPSEAFLEALVLKGLRRGIPVQVAEDLVMEAWERSRRAFDPGRGSFEGLLLRATEHAFAGWWRAEVRAERARRSLEMEPAVEPPRLVRPEAADHLQEQVLAALTNEERRLFSTWALSHHLPRGTFTAARAARSLGMTVGVYDHARRALADRVRNVLTGLGADVHDLLDLEPDQGTAHAPHRSRR